MKKTVTTITLITLLAIGLSGCVEKKDTNASTDNSIMGVNATSKPTKTPSPTPISELQITILKEGTGPAVKTGDTISVHYVGTFLDGSKFDSSRDRGTPFSFTVGQGRVIQGWDKGVVGMKVGELRKLLVPPAMGYGSQDYGPIPGNSVLSFEIELLKIN